MDKDLDDFFRPATDVHLSEKEAQTCHKQLLQKMTSNPVRDAKNECHTEHMTELDPAFIHASQAVSLTKSESALAAASLHAFMKEHPVDMRAAVAKRHRKSPWDTLNALFSMRHGTALAAIFLCVLGGGSLSYAAESALPGDTLYPIKLNVNEEVRAKLSLTPAAKAMWNAKRADRRVQEVARMVERGTLTAAARTKLTTHFNTFVAQAEENIRNVERSGHHEDARSLQTFIDQKIGEHTMKLIAFRETHKNDAENENHREMALFMRTVEGATDRTIALQPDTSVDSFAAENDESKNPYTEAKRERALIAVEKNADHTLKNAILDALHEQNKEKNDPEISIGTMMQIAPLFPPDEKDGVRKKNKQNNSASSTGSGSASVQSASASENASSSTSIRDPLMLPLPHARKR